MYKVTIWCRETDVFIEYSSEDIPDFCVFGEYFGKCYVTYYTVE